MTGPLRLSRDRLGPWRRWLNHGADTPTHLAASPALPCTRRTTAVGPEPESVPGTQVWQGHCVISCGQQVWEGYKVCMPGGRGESTKTLCSRRVFSWNRRLWVYTSSLYPTLPHFCSGTSSSQAAAAAPLDARQTIAKDFLEELPLWKLSCYGHRKGGGPCDLFGDASMEEARWKHYDVSGGAGVGARGGAGELRAPPDPLG